MKVLVIGSEGNIGVPLVKYLNEKGYDVLESDIIPGNRKNYHMADINHPIDLIDAFDWKPDIVILLSAMVSRVTCEKASSLAISTNLAGINNVIQLAKRVNAFLVFFSTSEVYGPHCNPMSEKDPNVKPNNRYGLSKLLGEQLVEYEVRTYGLKAVTLRPFMMYDENETLGEHRSAMIRFATLLSLHKPIEVHNGSRRGWLHSSDAVRLIERSFNLEEYSIINIGHPDIVSISRMAEMVRVELNAPEDLVTNVELPERMTLIKEPELLRQEKILGLKPEISLEKGIKLVCKSISERIRNEKYKH